MNNSALYIGSQDLWNGRIKQLCVILDYYMKMNDLLTFVSHFLVTKHDCSKANLSDINPKPLLVRIRVCRTVSVLSLTSASTNE